MKYTIEMRYTIEAYNINEALMIQEELEDDLDETFSDFELDVEYSKVVEHNPNATF